MPSVTQTIAFIKKAHAGQKYGNEPYWTHPVAVMHRMLDKGASLDELKVALLHDVIEDTKYTATDLANMGYSKTVWMAVRLLTKEPGRDYFAYIRDLIRVDDKIALRVKLHDNLENYSNNPTEKQKEKYQKSIIMLTEVLL
jgi:(p)ppGpp synthase/HD superfamily hydrolase